MLPRVSMLRSFGYLARRGVTTTATRLSEGAGVSRDGKEFVRMLKTDRLLMPLLLTFSGVFGIVNYNVSLKALDPYIDLVNFFGVYI